MQSRLGATNTEAAPALPGNPYYQIAFSLGKGILKMPITSQEMIKLLKKNGFETVSQNGSHVKMRNPNTGKTVIVPYHSKDLKKGMEQAILKQAGLK